MEAEESLDYNSIDSTDIQFQNVSREIVATSTKSWVHGDPYLRIVEQPHPTLYRFRYKSEGRLAGSIPGINSTDNNKTFTTIEVMNFQGYVELVVSCVTVEEPYLQHPHNLVSKKGSKHGVYCCQIRGPTMQTTLSNVGIRCVKKDGVLESLKNRKKVNFDPFGGGLKNENYQFNLSAVRLCFQGFIPNGSGGYYKLPPVVSEPITDKKHVYKLEIVGLCSCSAKAAGGTEIYMFCSPMPAADVKIRFYEEIDGHTIWETYAKFEKTDVHLKCGIRFKTPPYRKLNIDKPVQVLVQLERISTEASTSAQASISKEYSEPLPFDYTPDPERLKRLRLERSRVYWERFLSNETVNTESSTGSYDNDLEMQSNLNLTETISQSEKCVDRPIGNINKDSIQSIPSYSIALNKRNSESVEKVMYMWNSQHLKYPQQSFDQPHAASFQSENQQLFPLLQTQHLQPQTVCHPLYHNQQNPSQTMSLSDELEEILNKPEQHLEKTNSKQFSNRNQQTAEQVESQISHSQESIQNLYRDQEQPPQQFNPYQHTPMQETYSKQLPAFQVLKNTCQSEYFQHSLLTQQQLYPNDQTTQAPQLLEQYLENEHEPIGQQPNYSCNKESYNF